MKRFTVFVLVTLMLVLITINDADCKKLTMDEAKKTIKNLRKPCSKKNDTPKELLDGQHLGEFPRDERLMCYMKCILVSTKTMKNDEVQWDWFTKNARLMLVDEYIPRVDHLVEVCRNRVKGADGCEVAWEFGKCAWEVDKEVILKYDYDDNDTFADVISVHRPMNLTTEPRDEQTANFLLPRHQNHRYRRSYLRASRAVCRDNRRKPQCRRV